VGGAPGAGVVPATANVEDAATALSTAVKGEDGKWSQVEVGYIDSRTRDPNRLAARRSLPGDGQNVSSRVEEAVSALSTAVKGEDGKWSRVETTSYIDSRTKDTNRLFARRSSLPGNLQQSDAAAVVAASSAVKGDDGKWTKVETSYIDWRTKDCDRLVPRRSICPTPAANVATPLGSASSVKDDDGKCRLAETQYINQRTREVDNLEGRKALKATEAGAAQPQAVMSATVKKQEDGTWKVDTNYIGHRSQDPDNLRGDMDAGSMSIYALPAQTKYTLQELTAPPGERPADVDPAVKEQYLSAVEFQDVFGIGAESFLKFPKWKQQNLKKAKGLF